MASAPPWLGCAPTKTPHTLINKLRVYGVLVGSRGLHFVAPPFRFLCSQARKKQNGTLGLVAPAVEHKNTRYASCFFSSAAPLRFSFFAKARKKMAPWANSAHWLNLKNTPRRFAPLLVFCVLGHQNTLINRK